jgi:hypothetical protein
MYIRRQSFERTDTLFIDIGDFDFWLTMSAKRPDSALRNRATFETHIPNFWALDYERLGKVSSRNVFSRIRNNVQTGVTRR